MKLHQIDHIGSRHASRFDFIAEVALDGLAYTADRFNWIPSQLVHVNAFLRTERGILSISRRLYSELRERT